MTQFLVLCALASSWYMAGLIWFVQIVHYPLYAAVGADAFAAYEKDHMRRTGYVVFPAMVTELVASAALLWWKPAGVPEWLLWAGLGMVAAIWVSTFTLQVPAHKRLLNGFAEGPWRLLVWSNWIRTVLWTGRAGVMGGIAYCQFPIAY